MFVLAAIVNVPLGSYLVNANGLRRVTQSELMEVEDAVATSDWWMSRGRSEFGARMWSSRPGPQSGLAHAALGRLQ